MTAEGVTILGVSAATLALIISIICLVWIILHIGQRKNWPLSNTYSKLGLFEGGEYY